MELCARLGISLLNTEPYSPESKGKIERFNRTIQQTIMDMTLHKKRIPIIILDDAHFLRNENFFEPQLLSNFNFDSLSPALFILIAQPHLLERLRRPVFDSFYQRISIKINLQSLSSQDTHQFILHLLKNASSSSNHVSVNHEHLFTPQAIELIFKRSAGKYGTRFILLPSPSNPG